MLENHADTIVANVLALCIVCHLAAMVLNVWDKRVGEFDEEEFQLCVPDSEKW